MNRSNPNENETPSPFWSDKTQISCYLAAEILDWAEQIEKLGKICFDNRTDLPTNANIHRAKEASESCGHQMSIHRKCESMCEIDFVSVCLGFVWVDIYNETNMFGAVFEQILKTICRYTKDTG